MAKKKVTQRSDGDQHPTYGLDIAHTWALMRDFLTMVWAEVPDVWNELVNTVYPLARTLLDNVTDQSQLVPWLNYQMSVGEPEGSREERALVDQWRAGLGAWLKDSHLPADTFGREISSRIGQWIMAVQLHQLSPVGEEPAPIWRDPLQRHYVFCPEQDFAAGEMVVRFTPWLPGEPWLVARKRIMRAAAQVTKQYRAEARTAFQAADFMPVYRGTESRHLAWAVHYQVQGWNYHKIAAEWGKRAEVDASEETVRMAVHKVLGALGISTRERGETYSGP